MRLFLALEPDAATRAHIARAQEQVLGVLRGAVVERAARSVRPEQAHLTLLFLGEVEEARRGDIEGQVLEAARSAAPLELSVGGFGAFPKPSAPRVLWLGVEEDAGLRALHADLLARLGGLCPQLDRKALRPHLSLARVREISASERRRLAQALEGLPTPAPHPWPSREVCLIRSELAPGGPIYSTLLAAALGPERNGYAAAPST